MTDQQETGEEVHPGYSASVENRGASGLSIAILMAGGSRIEMELAPGQALEVVAGEEASRVVLREGNRDDLLVVMPGTP